MKGHIYKRGKAYTYVIDLGKNPITNKRQQKSKGGFRRKKAAQDALAKILTEYNEGFFINEAEIMDRLGHKDDSITRNIYLHVTKDMKKEASQKFSELMKGF